jgi:hypothetical protein
VRRHGLVLHDVEYFPDLHGGTLRWHIGHRGEPSDRLTARLADERAQGLDTFEPYEAFGSTVSGIRDELRSALQELRSAGRTVAGYGAAAKGATLLNYCGIGTDLVQYVVDRNTHKQGLHMPGTHQLVRSPDALVDERTDDVLLLAWNFADEIVAQQQDYVAGGGRFIVPVPHVRFLD